MFTPRPLRRFSIATGILAVSLGTLGVACSAEPNSSTGDDDIYESGFAGTWVSHGTWVQFELRTNGTYELLKRPLADDSCRPHDDARIQTYASDGSSRDKDGRPLALRYNVSFGALRLERGTWALERVFDRDAKRELRLIPTEGDAYSVPISRKLYDKPLIGIPEPEANGWVHTELTVGDDGSNEDAHYADIPHQAAEYLSYDGLEAQPIPTCGPQEHLCVDMASNENVYARDRVVLLRCKASCDEWRYPNAFARHMRSECVRDGSGRVLKFVRTGDLGGYWELDARRNATKEP